MLRSEKKNFVSELENIYKNSSSIIITHYHGLTVAELTNLRNALRDEGAYFKIVKNTLSRIAAKNVGYDFDMNIFGGPTAIAYSLDPISAAKGVVKFAKTHSNLKVVGGIVENKMLAQEGVEQLAKMPSLDELRGRLVGLLCAPATNLVRTLQAPAGQLARVCRAYADKSK